jgi:lauroyl/myristoyl acyltransferase
VLALRTGKPLVLATSFSTGRPLEYEGVLMPPLVPDLTADPAAEEMRLLTAMNRQYEAFIRAHPEQWNWIHPRWETRPPQPTTVLPAP